jgi:hypothetical protein
MQQVHSSVSGNRPDAARNLFVGTEPGRVGGTGVPPCGRLQIRFSEEEEVAQRYRCQEDISFTHASNLASLNQKLQRIR